MSGVCERSVCAWCVQCGGGDVREEGGEGVMNCEELFLVWCGSSRDFPLGTPSHPSPKKDIPLACRRGVRTTVIKVIKKYKIRDLLSIGCSFAHQISVICCCGVCAAFSVVEVWFRFCSGRFYLDTRTSSYKTYRLLSFIYRYTQNIRRRRI